MHDDPDSLDEGQVLGGRYRIGRILGEGGYGRVYRATDLRTSSEVAVKIIHGIDDELRARFALEADIVRKLESPHTVRLLDHGEAFGAPFMVLELLDGTSVFDLLSREETLSPAVALEITAQLLDALAEAHAMGIVHRDIKPENVFVTSRLGQPTFAKLLDFGIARHGATKNLTMQGQVIGTPSYMAPEQTSGGAVDARTDLYAVGLLLAEMITGRTVMGSGGPMTIMIAQAKKEPVPLGDDVRGSIVGAIVERAVKKTPAERYESATHMLVDVRAVLADVDAAGVGPTPTAHDAPVAPSPPWPTSSPTFSPHSQPSSPIAPPLAQPIAPPLAQRFGPAPVPVTRRRRGPFVVPIAIVVAALLASIAIVLVTTRSSRDERHTDQPPREVDQNLPHPRVRQAKTTDVAEIRRILLGAGYTLTVDEPSATAHTFAAVKLPCAGTVMLMTVDSESIARMAASNVAKSPNSGVPMLQGRVYLNVALARDGGGSVDAGCTEPVAALLAR